MNNMNRKLSLIAASCRILTASVAISAALAITGLLTACATSSNTGLLVPRLPSEANQELVDFHKKIYEPARLEKIGNRVHMSLGHSYANFSFIEGDDGVILIDAGFFTGNAEEALALYRKTVTNKPIVGMIYTHAHGDHRGGSSVFLKDAGREIPVYAPADWMEDSAYMESSLRDMVLHKAFSQFGVILPEGIDGTVGSGIGPITRSKGNLDFVLPNHDVHDVREITISDVKIVLIPVYADIKGHMWVWLPNEKLMFTGDTLMGTTMPYIATARFEPDRRALEFVKSLDRLKDYPVEYVVPGHGRPLIGKEDVEEISILNRDFAQLLANQVTRFILKGYTADQAIDNFKLPPSMMNHPDMQPYYHRLPWIIRGLYVKRTGWVDSVYRLIRHTESQEAERMVQLLGGEHKVNEHALEVFKSGDYRWSAQLANLVLQVNPNNQSAAELQKQSFKGIANTTRSANERNYMLSKIKELEGQAPWNAMFVKVGLPARMQQSNDALLKLLEDRFKSEDALTLAMRIAVAIEGEKGQHSMRIRNGVLIYEGMIGGDHDGAFTVSHAELAKLVTGAIPWAKAVDQGVVKVISGAEAVKTFTSLIEVKFG